MPRDFYPRADAEVVTFTRNLSNAISADPEGYGFSAQTSADYATLQQAFAQAFAATRDNGTNCSTSYTVKKTAAVALEKATRSLVRQMKADPDVTASMLQAAGLSQRAPKRQRVQVPGVPPTLRIVEQLGGQFTLEVSDSESTRRGLPRDVAMVAIYGFVGDELPVRNAGFFPLKESSRANRVRVQFSPLLPPGTKVWLSAHWRSPRGEPGPGCQPVCAYLGQAVLLPGRNLRAAA